MELSPHNEKTLELIENSALMICFDDNEPVDYSEVGLKSIDGDFHSRWCDKGSVFISFKNGKIGCVGEHSLYDGTISASYSFFLLLSLMEEPEPDWNMMPEKVYIPKEIKFEIDDKLKAEILRMDQYVEDQRNSVLVKCAQFDGYGKNFMKDQKVHPDSYVQMALIYAFYKLHGWYPPTYETATMRVYYRGRTETVRSCSVETVNWIEAMKNPKLSVNK